MTLKDLAWLGAVPQLFSAAWVCKHGAGRDLGPTRVVVEPGE